MTKQLTLCGLLLCIALTAHSADRSPIKASVVPSVYSLRMVSHVYQPFVYKSNGVIAGALVKVMGAICAEAKVSCTTEMHSFEESMKLISSGEADVIFTLTVNEDPDERNEKIIYASMPLVRSSYAFFVPYDSNWTGNLEDINEFTLYAFGPSATSLIAQETNPKSLVMATSNIMAFQNMLLAPRGDKVAVVVNKDTGFYMLTQGSVRGPKFAGIIKDSYLGFGFSRKSKNLHLYRPLLEATNKLLVNKTISKILTTNNPPLSPVEDKK